MEARSTDDTGDDQVEARSADDEQEEVRRRAYDRYLARGDGPGSEMDDWIEAEREVRSAGARNARGDRDAGEGRGAS